jgi:beta-glucosidase
MGLNAPSVPVLLGNYNGTPSAPVTILNGIRDVAGSDIEVIFTEGCSLAWPNGTTNETSDGVLSNALETAKTADVIIYVGGISPLVEGEEMYVNYEGFSGGDRTRIELPRPQTDLLKALHATGKPVVFVNCSGSAVAMPWEGKNLPAIVQAWYPGQAGGRAVAEVLFGDANPGGRLPVTFYASTDDLPSFESYSMSNRTYRYFEGKPQFAFGHGLSYTRFEYGIPKLESAKVRTNATLKLSFALKNIGSRDGDEVAQVYFRGKTPNLSRAKLSLCGFTRVHLAKGETMKVTLEIPLERLRHWSTAEKKYVVAPGDYELLVGSASDDIKARLPLTVTALK